MLQLFIKNIIALFMLTLSSISIMGMEKPKSYPQLQLRSFTEKDLIHVTSYGTITNFFDSPISYTSSSYHTHHRLSSTIHDPLVLFKIIDDLSQPKSRKIIPLKDCFNLNDKSILMTLKTSGSKLYPHDPQLKNKLFIEKIVCIKNPEFPGDNFAEQINLTKAMFYKKPYHFIDTTQGDSIQEFLDTGILEEEKEIGLAVWPASNGRRAGSEEYKIYQHGPNGCSNDEKLKQSIIEEKIPSNKSAFKSLRKRELTSSFK